MTPDPKQRLPRELLRELIEEGSEAFRGVLEKLINAAMQLEREEFLGARRWERSEQRRDHANGYKDKTLSTRVGQLRIRIPQVRHLDFYPRSLERGCRSEKALKLAIAEMYVMGVSTRKVTEITEQLCGTEISASQVSRISKLLDDELEQFRNRPLGSYPVVYLDAHYEKVRRQGSIQDVAVLKATGVNCWGKREVIGVSCRLSEAEVHWRGFLQQLQKRGLEGVQLIVSDDHSGLRAARRAVFPSVPWQRCQFHLSQNAQRYARRSDQRAAIATDIRDIFNAPSGGEGDMLRTRVEQYRDRNPELADWMETNLPEGFTVFRFARSTWRRIRTNNGLENLNRQIRRRTRVVGIFPNTESALRLITAVVEEIHEDWLIGKQYLSLVDFNPQETCFRSLSVKLQKNSCVTTQIGRGFTMLLVVTSIGIAGYAISTVAAYVVEGEFNRVFRGRKMDKRIARMRDHIVLCGAGRTGAEIAQELYKTLTPFVIIEKDEKVLQRLPFLREIPYLQGDATRDSILQRSGVERAKGLLAVLPNDQANVFLVLTVRALSPKLRIISRLTDDSNRQKLLRAGADTVVQTQAIGGLRMASMMIRPSAVTFLDKMLRVTGETLRVEDVTATPSMQGKTLRQLELNERIGLLVVALQRPGEQEYSFNPKPETELGEGDVLIVIGSPRQVRAAREV